MSALQRLDASSTWRCAGISKVSPQPLWKPQRGCAFFMVRQGFDCPRLSCAPPRWTIFASSSESMSSAATARLGLMSTPFFCSVNATKSPEARPSPGPAAACRCRSAPRKCGRCGTGGTRPPTSGPDVARSSGDGSALPAALLGSPESSRTLATRPPQSKLQFAWWRRGNQTNDRSTGVARPRPGISLSPVPPLTSLQAYLDRIGLGGRADPGLAEVHRAHATGISFENFDPFSGTPVSLELADLEDKIVTRRPRRLLLRAQPAPQGRLGVARRHGGDPHAGPGAPWSRRLASPPQPSPPAGHGPGWHLAGRRGVRRRRPARPASLRDRHRVRTIGLALPSGRGRTRAGAPGVPGRRLD